MRGSTESREEEGRPIQIQVQLGKSQGLPFPHFYADAIATRTGQFDTIQLTFQYLPYVDELFRVTGPDPEEVRDEVPVEAYIVAQVTVPRLAFEQWFNELASRRGLIPPVEEAQDGND